MAIDHDLDSLRAENEQLRRELTDANDALRAIRAGEVDALVVHTREGDRVFTLESAYEPYRVLVEHMQQGAASLTPDGLILYVNTRFADILAVSPERLVGTSVHAAVGEAHRTVVASLLASAADRPVAAELILHAHDGRPLHALFHVTALPDGTRCAVVTDVTERIRQAEILASREWLRVTLTSIGDAVLSCDTEGLITFLNPVAETLTGWSHDDAMGQPIQRVFRITDEITHRTGEDIVGRVLREGQVVTLENHTVLMTRDGRELAVEDSAAPIRDAQGRLAGAVLVFHDATEKRRAQHALRESEARLLEANRAKDDFLATLSHELRTPMSAILGWAQMLTTRHLDEATRTRGLQAIVRNAHAQMQLVTDILDVSRIVSGRLRLEIRPVDLVAVVYAALDSIRPAADAKGIALTTSISAESTVIPGDADRLQQVVWNLLSNAVKFTSSGGRVDVALQRTGSQFAIRVTDSGIGIHPDLLPRVFDRFVQADTSTKRQQSGLGLGLSIVRHLVELHGGTVEAQSEGPGKGATFAVHFPVAAIASPKREAPAGLLPAPDPVLAGSLDGIRVLVVDDDADTRDVVGTLLKDCGADVATAASAAEGLERLKAGPFDVLLADIGMPVQDGYEFIAKVRSLPADAGGTVPAAALTAYGRPGDAERARSCGYQLFLTKPVAPDQLAAAVAQLARTPHST